MRSRQDQSIKGYKAELKRDPLAARAKADAIVRNTYRTLMTRGMKGCFVYCVDQELSKHLRGRRVTPDDPAALKMVAEQPADYPDQ
jgi:DUF2075 family protein